MRRRTLAIPIATIAALLLAVGTVAGGWATVALVDPPVDPPAGSGTLVELDVLQHGETPVSWVSLTVVATNDASGDSFTTPARAEGPTGRYAATITFPTEGRWTLSFESPDLIMDGTATVQVAAAVAAAPIAAEPSTSAVAGLDPAALAVVAVIIVAVVAAGAIAMRGRHAGRHDEQASVSG